MSGELVRGTNQSLIALLLNNGKKGILGSKLFPCISQSVKVVTKIEELVKVNKKFQKATEVSTLVQMLINWATKMEIDEVKRPSFPWTGRREEVEQKVKKVFDDFLSDQ